MAKFYASVTNSRGNVQGHSGRSTGQEAHIRSWNAGIDVRAFIDCAGNESFAVSATKGSNGDGACSARLGTLVATPDGLRWYADADAPDTVKRI